MSSGSGSDPHMLALLRAMRLRSAAPDAVAAGEADADAALAGQAAAGDNREGAEPVHPESLLHPHWPSARTENHPSVEPPGEQHALPPAGQPALPAAHPFHEVAGRDVPRPERERTAAEAAGDFRAALGSVPSSPRPSQPAVPPAAPAPSTPAPATGTPGGSSSTSGTSSSTSGTSSTTGTSSTSTPSVSSTPSTPSTASTPSTSGTPSTSPGTPATGSEIIGSVSDAEVTASTASAATGVQAPTSGVSTTRATGGVTGPGTGSGSLPGHPASIPSETESGASLPASMTQPIIDGPVRPAAPSQVPARGPAGSPPPPTDVDPGHLLDLLPEHLTRATPPTPGTSAPAPQLPGSPPPAPGRPNVIIPPAAGGPGTPTPATPRLPLTPPVPGMPPTPGGPTPGTAVPAGAIPGTPAPATPQLPPSGPVPGGPSTPGTLVPRPGASTPALPGTPTPALPGTPAPALPGNPTPTLPGTPTSTTPAPAFPTTPATRTGVPINRPTIPYPPGPGPWTAASTQPIEGISGLGGPRPVGAPWPGDPVQPLNPAAPLRPPVPVPPARTLAPVDGMNPADDAMLHEVRRLLGNSLSLAGGPQEVADRLRAALVQAEPALFRTIPGSPGSQAEQLADGLTWLVHTFDQPPALVAGFGRLGAALAECGVAPQQLQLAGAALAEAMRAGMAANGWRQDFDQAWRSTWQHAYEWIVHGMATARYEPTTWTAVVVSHDLRREDLAVVRLRPYLPMPYRPGQYARIEVPELPGVWRPYSLAGAPRRDNVVELHVRAKSVNGVSGTLVHRLTAGDKVRISRAEGAMGLPESGRPLLMIAGDTGVAPLKALLTELAATGDARSAVLFWGARTLDELYDIEDVAAIARSARRATVVPVISEGPSGPYASGLVTDAVAAYGEWSEHEVYLAGPPLMLAATSAALHQLGVAPERIHHDAPE
ncbi:FAD-binding oxidoreductase [Actinoplanes sp. NPDC049548]|uniref:FAD-binding oxidoreductase n=1 Tax=Actinoplanes sp. NPDC049548 TaxID=3155152 RepID=UPI00343F5905